MNIASPFPRLGPQALEAAALAAGYAQACFAGADAPVAEPRISWLGMFPSPASFFLAVFFLMI